MEFEISLVNLSFYAFHGVFEEEKKTGNTFIVNLSVFVDVNPESFTDEVSSTVSYADLFEIIKKEMIVPANLLESVLLRISKEIKVNFPGVKRGKISIEKKHPPIPGMIGQAVVALNF